MDTVTLKVALEAARQFTTEAAGASFTLRLPTEHAWRTTLEQHRDSERRLLESRAYRAILNEAVVGWTGVTTRFLLEEGEAEPLDFSADNLQVLLDHRQDIADALFFALGARLAEKRRKREDAAKN